MRYILPKLRGGFYEPSSVFFVKFPIPKFDNAVAKQLENLASQIMKSKSTHQDTTALEREIDELVYALYDLTPEEIALVEGA